VALKRPGTNNHDRGKLVLIKKRIKKNWDSGGDSAPKHKKPSLRGQPCADQELKRESTKEGKGGGFPGEGEPRLVQFFKRGRRRMKGAMGSRGSSKEGGGKERSRRIKKHIGTKENGKSSLTEDAENLLADSKKTNDLLMRRARQRKGIMGKSTPQRLVGPLFNFGGEDSTRGGSGDAGD